MLTHAATIPSPLSVEEPTQAKEIPAATSMQQLWLSGWCIFSPLGRAGREREGHYCSLAFFFHDTERSWILPSLISDTISVLYTTQDRIISSICEMSVANLEEKRALLSTQSLWRIEYEFPCESAFQIKGKKTSNISVKWLIFITRLFS